MNDRIYLRFQKAIKVYGQEKCRNMWKVRPSGRVYTELKPIDKKEKVLKFFDKVLKKKK